MKMSFARTSIFAIITLIVQSEITKVEQIYITAECTECLRNGFEFCANEDFKSGFCCSSNNGYCVTEIRD